MDTHAHGHPPHSRNSEVERRNKVLTAKVSGREESYGTYLYMHLSKAVERRKGWQRGDIVQLILDEDRNLIILKQIFRWIMPLRSLSLLRITSILLLESG